jgi:VWFA-related protein
MSYSAESLERVYLRLTVTLSDSEGDRLVPGLVREDFEVFDQGIPQFIDYFSAAPSPSSVTILLDMDGSMRSIDLSSTLARLIEICNAQTVPDEISLIAFSDKSAMVKNFAWRVRNINFSEVLNLIEGGNRYGKTGLLQALSLASESIQTHARNYNQAVIIITDAEDDFSHSEAVKVQNQIESMGLRVYGVFFPGEHRLDHGRLHKLSTLTGGRYFQISDPTSLDLIVRWFLHELRYQYVVGFTPNSALEELEKGRISVRLSGARVKPGMSVRFTPTNAMGRTYVKKQGS